MLIETAFVFWVVQGDSPNNIFYIYRKKPALIPWTKKEYSSPCAQVPVSRSQGSALWSKQSFMALRFFWQTVLHRFSPVRIKDFHNLLLCRRK
jgi:hypothetical protein